ncbi:MAG TPA: hypothetical protein VJ768_05085, partial [Anaerolineales bacterium]|nr:hypothetical protein [Anaerolineales bacterium]
GVAPWATAPVAVIGLTPASLAINHPFGQAGSYFLIQGQDFLPGTTAAVTVNGYTFGNEIQVGPDGSFSLLVETGQADEGDYFLSAEYILEAITIFHISADAPLLPQEGSGYMLTLPPGIGLGDQTYLPFGM